MIASANAEQLLLTVETRANTAGLSQARAGVDDLNKSVDGMSAHSKAAFDAMNPAQQRAYQAFVSGGKAAREQGAAVESIVAPTGRAEAATSRGEAALRRMTLQQIEAIRINERLTAGTEAATVSTVAGTRNMGTWGALQAEAAGHTGNHSLSIGRLEMALASYAGKAVGANRVTELLATTMGRFALGSIWITGILIGASGVVWAYDKLTDASRKVEEASDKAIASIEKMLHLKSLGAGADLQDQVSDINKQINVLAARLQTARDAAKKQESSPFGEGKTTVADIEADIQGLRKTRDAAVAEITDIRVKADWAAASALFDAEKAAGVFPELDKKKGKSGERADDKWEKAQLANAERGGAAATEAIARALDEQDKLRKRAAETEEKDGERAFAMTSVMSSKTLDLVLARENKVFEIEKNHANREYLKQLDEIQKLQISEDEKTKLIVLAAQERDAAVNVARAKQQTKEEAGAAKALALEERKAAKRLAIIRGNIDRIVNAEGSVVQTLKRIALEPVVSELESIAAKEAVKALEAAASFNFPGAALHTAAAAAAIVAAHEVAGWAGGSSSGGSSGSAGGAGSGGSQGGGTFEPRTGAQGAGSVTINLITRNPYGRDQVQQVMWEINRAGILNRPPVEIPPTTGIQRGAA